MVSKFKRDPMFIIRVVLGIAFIAHGISKLMGLSSTADMLGMSVSLVTIVALLELLAGLAILFNKYVKYSATIIVIIMFAAIAMVKYKMGYLMGYELDVAYIAMALALIISTKCDCGVCPSCKNKK